MSDIENEHDNEVVINVDRRLERLELAQQAASTHAEQMLDCVCQCMEDGYGRICTDMARQDEACRAEMDDRCRSRPQLSQVSESQPSPPLYNYASTPIHPNLSRHSCRSAPFIPSSDSLPSGQAQPQNTQNSPIVVMPSSTVQ